MEIILGKTAGFCYGVKNAVSNAEEVLKKYKEITCLGELVHNGQVVKKLENLGLKVIDKIEDAESKVIVRAHGIAKDVYSKAKKLNIKVFDYTCPKVLKIHDIAEEYAKKGYFIFFIGGRNHPESIGTISFCGKNSYLIEDKEEIEDAINMLKKSEIKKLLVIVQTTFSLEKFNQYVSQIEENIPQNVKIEIKNTICNATKIRQEETEKISKEVDCMIIIGGKNSSNTKKLYEIANKNCKNTFIIETKDEIEEEKIQCFSKIGVMAGASTPEESIDEVIKKIEKKDEFENVRICTLARS